MAFAWKQAYSLKSIFKRLDFTRPKTLKTVFLLLNIGYRKYAKAYETYDVNLMTDNSDIPAGKEAARQEIKRNTDSAK